MYVRFVKTIETQEIRLVLPQPIFIEMLYSNSLKKSLKTVRTRKWDPQLVYRSIELCFEPVIRLLRRKEIPLNRQGKPPCLRSLNPTAMIKNDTGSPTKRVVDLCFKDNVFHPVPILAYLIYPNFRTTLYLARSPKYLYVKIAKCIILVFFESKKNGGTDLLNNPNTRFMF